MVGDKLARVPDLSDHVAVATDKTETDIESPAAGTLEIVGEVETAYPVGAVIGRLT